MGKTLLHILLFLAIVANSQSFDVSCEKTQLETGEQAQIKLKYKGIDPVIWIDNSNYKDTLSAAIEVIDYSKIDTINIKDTIEFSQTIIVTAWDSGHHIIPPLSIEVNGNTIYTKPLLLHYQLPKTNDKEAIKPIKNQIDTPFIFAEIQELVFWGIVLTILLVVLILIIVYLIKNHKNKKTEVIINKKPIIDSLTERYVKLKQNKIWLNNREKEFHSELSAILKEYLEYRYKIKSIESTSREIIQQLISLGIEKEITQDVKHILNFSDMIKFAKQKGVESQHEQALNILYSFLKTGKKVE